jgi:hypothetical protein
MPKGIKRITNGNESPLAALLDSLIALAEEDYAKLSVASLEGRKLRFELEAIRAKLG